MTNIEILNLIIQIMTLISLCLFLYKYKIIYSNAMSNKNKQETFIDIPNVQNINGVKWKIDDKCQYEMIKAFKEILKKHNIQKSNKDWTLYFPCTYNDVEDEVKDAINNVNEDDNKTNKRIFILNNCDEITGKNNIWNLIIKKKSYVDAIKIMPMTYILYDNNDIKRFKKDYDKNKIYIMKKNIQRQEGLKITKNMDDIIKGFENEYVIVQELLQNSYLVNGRKINMRIYLLIVCYDDDISVYVYNDGFMYYTKEKFKKNSINTDVNITTGYIDRQVYKENPLTLQDFKKYLDNNNRDLTHNELYILMHGHKLSDYVFNKIYDLFRNISEIIKDDICNKSSLKNTIMFQLFGADISLSDELEPQLMEINKGPDLGFKDDRDKNVKLGVVEDAFKILKLIPDNKHNYIMIY